MTDIDTNGDIYKAFSTDKSYIPVRQRCGWSLNLHAVMHWCSRDQGTGMDHPVSSVSNLAMKLSENSTGARLLDRLCSILNHVKWCYLICHTGLPARLHQKPQLLTCITSKMQQHIGWKSQTLHTSLIFGTLLILWVQQQVTTKCRYWCQCKSSISGYVLLSRRHVESGWRCWCRCGGQNWNWIE